MTLDITQGLRSPGQEIPFRHEVELPDQDLMGETVRFPQPAVVTGTYQMADERLRIHGRLRAEAHAQCARCLTPVVHQVDVPVDEAYTRLEPGEKVPEDPWEEHLVFHGSRVDLSHLVLSLVVLDLPIRFVCANGCAGAPQGAPEPQTTETEDTAAGEHPFSALKKLFNTEEEV